jgi:hypothetical protein
MYLWKQALGATIALCAIALFTYCLCSNGGEQTVVRRAPVNERAVSDGGTVPGERARVSPKEADVAASISWTLTVQAEDESGRLVLARVQAIDANGRRLGGKWVRQPARLELSGTVDIVVIPDRPYAPKLVRGVRPRDDERPMVVRVSRGKSVSGVVVNQQGRHVEHVMVRLVPIEAPAWFTGDREDDGSIAQASDDGNFTFGGLLPGNYRVVVSEDHPRRFPPPQPEHVVEAGQTGLRVSVHEAVLVRLQLIDKATQTPIESPISWRKYDQSGELDLSGGSSTGKYGVTVYAKQGSQLRIEVDAEGYRSAGMVRVPVRPDGLEQDVRVEFDHDPEAYAHVELVVSDPSGAAVETLSVYREAVREDRRSRDGRYILRLPPGEHELILETPRKDFFELKPSWIPLPIQVSVERGQKILRRVVMCRGAWIRVRTNRPLDENGLQLFDGERQVDASFHENLVSGGYVCLAPPGSYLVRASFTAAGKKEAAEATVNATAGSVADVTLWFRR